MKSTIGIVISQYRQVTLEFAEKSLEVWLSSDWSGSPYKDILAPYLILRKLELNEEEY